MSGGAGGTDRAFLKPTTTSKPASRAIPQEAKKTESYPQLSAIKPLGRAPRLLEADSMTAMIAMKVAFLSGGALAPIYPRLGPKSAERTSPQKKKMAKMAGTFWVKTKKGTTRAQTKVPMFRGSFIPILSAIHPQELSPMTMPTMATENIKPSILGVTPIEVR